MEMKYPRMELGTIEAIINRLGGMEGAKSFLKDGTLIDYKALERFVTKDGKITLADFMKCVFKWREQDGVIYPNDPFVSDGTSGPDWITRLEKKGFKLGEYEKSVLRSPHFKPTKPGTVTDIAILKGELFSDDNRVTRNIRAQAYEGKFTGGKNLFVPNAEISCLFRERFTNEEIEAMGLYRVVSMHEPINDSGGDPSLLSAGRDDDGRWLSACCGGPGSGWSRESGFAFAVAQVCPKN